MSEVAVCTDSSALLADADAARLGIDVVPIVVELDGVPVPELSPEDFYVRLAAGAAAATSLPSPAAFQLAYGAAAARGARHVLSIHLDGRASGTAGAAELAARNAPVEVTVVTTVTASFGVGICARAAADALAAGASPGAAADVARRLGSTVQNAFVAPGAPGGRVSSSAGWPVLSYADGQTRALAACADAAAAIPVIVERVLGARVPVRAAVGHASSVVEGDADALAAALAGSSRVTAVERYRVRPAVGAHTGPLSFGAFWWPA